MEGQAVTTTDFQGLRLIHRGKVRDMYEIPGCDQELLMVASDRISAYDVVMNEPVPGKGEILTKLSLFWFDLLKDIVGNHLITADVNQYPEACRPYADVLKNRSMLIRKTNPLPIECIVRGYISGSFWKAYQKSNVVCGFELPEGMKEGEKFPEPLFTPSSKAEAGDHDENISLEQMETIVGRERTQEISSICVKLYKTAADYALSKGVIIADTKFELGLVGDELIVIDEVLTPDSSRFWPLEDYKPGQGQPSFDKQFLRDYLSSLDWDKNPPAPVLPVDIVEKTSLRYQQALKLIKG